MIYYMVTLFGNRRTATIKKDYMVTETASYTEARKLLEANGGWGNVREAGSKAEAVESNNLFINEVMGQCLSIGRV